jgi:hypothetical protein
MTVQKTTVQKTTVQKTTVKEISIKMTFQDTTLKRNDGLGKNCSKSNYLKITVRKWLFKI